MQVADREDSKSSVCLWDLFSHFRFQIRRPFSTQRYPIHRTAVPETFPRLTFRASIVPAPFRARDFGDDGGQAEQDQYRGYTLDRAGSGPE